MFRQFAAASVVAGVAVGCATIFVLAMPGLGDQKSTPLLALWCVAPLVWALWAAVAPASWVPRRLPLWGALLGLLAGFLGAFALNMPLRVLGVALPVAWRGALAVVIAAFYYVLWLFVRTAYEAFSPPAAASQPGELKSRAA